MTYLKRPIQLKSISALLLMFFFGSALLFGAYYVLSYSTIQGNEALRFEIMQLDIEIANLSSHAERLAKSPFPTNDELFRYAKMIPKEREVLRFIRSIDDRAKLTGFGIESLQINDLLPITSDLLDKLLVFLEERAQSLPPEVLNGKGIDIIGNLMAQMDENYQNSAGSAANEPVAPVDDGPLKRVILTLEYSATDQQLLEFLGLVRLLERTTYIDPIEFERDGEGNTYSGSMSITIFYYDGEFPFIPTLPVQ